MTLDLASLRKLALAATPGVWHLTDANNGTDEWCVWSGECWAVHIADCGPSEKSLAETKSNAEFIVALRNNIDELLRLAEIGQRVETAPPVDGAA